MKTSDRKTLGWAIFGNAFWAVVALGFLVFTVATGSGDGGGVSGWTWLALIVWSYVFASYLHKTAQSIFQYRETVDIVAEDE